MAGAEHPHTQPAASDKQKVDMAPRPCLHQGLSLAVHSQRPHKKLMRWASSAVEAVEEAGAEAGGVEGAGAEAGGASATGSTKDQSCPPRF